jgi:uncharacterized protein YdaU (DUF1376 family)
LKNKEAIKKAPPAFQFYATDTLASKSFRLMKLNERGLYITLLAECWANNTVPADPDTLSNLLGLDIEGAYSENVLEFFKIDQNQISSPELDDYKKKLDERRQKQIAGGKKGQQVKKRRVLQGQPSGLRVEKNGEERNGEEKSLYKEEIVGEIDKAWVEDYEK